jgi:hypothetical protein
VRPITTVRHFVESFLRSRARLEAPPSATGAQLDALRYSVDGSLFIRDGGEAGRAVWSATDRLAFHARLSLVWGSLDSEEQTVLEMSHTAKGVSHIPVERRVSQMEGADGASLLWLVKDATGELTDRAVYLVAEPQKFTAGDIAMHMRLSERQVRRRITTAGEKIRERLGVLGGEGD